MDEERIFKVIQKIMEDVPLVLAGSGCSAPYGLPSMAVLGAHLMEKLSPKYSGNAQWDKFQTELSRGADLEAALTDVLVSKEMLDDIRIECWKCISKYDFEFFDKLMFDPISFPLADLLKTMSRPHPSCVNIVTTNYDRVIEYACDHGNLAVNTGFAGQYCRWFSSNAFPTKNSINLIKVHGSLDTYIDSHGASFSVPLQRKLPAGIVPDMITPGTQKYQAVLTGPVSRQLLHTADEFIMKASSFLCIGYGFNDEQIQQNIFTQTKKGVPIIVLTKMVSEKTATLLDNSTKNYISIAEGPEEGTTELWVNRKKSILEGTYWTVEGFMKIIS